MKPTTLKPGQKVRYTGIGGPMDLVFEKRVAQPCRTALNVFFLGDPADQTRVELSDRSVTLKLTRIAP